MNHKTKNKFYLKIIITTCLVALFTPLPNVALANTSRVNVEMKTNTVTLANTDSVETEEEATVSAQTIEELKKRIEKNSNRIRGVINSLIHPKKGLVGEVQRVTEDAVTVRTQKGAVIIPINDDLEILRQSRSIPVSDIAIGNWGTVLGLEQDGVFVPKFLNISVDNLRPKEQVVRLGMISNVTANSINFIARSNLVESEVSITQSTQIEDVSGEKIAKSQLDEDLHILLIGWQNEDKIEAVRIHTLAPIN